MLKAAKHVLCVQPLQFTGIALFSSKPAGDLG